MSAVWPYLSVVALMLTGLLLIFIILLQRGRGGGLAGAFGGAGGQSALGTKAGDVFTRITVGLAVFWVLLACISIYSLRAGSEGRISLPSEEGSASAAPVPGEAPADDTDEEDRPAGATTAGTTRPDVAARPPETPAEGANAAEGTGTAAGSEAPESDGASSGAEAPAGGSDGTP
jgi:preprotein translocase subunit SecG